MLSTNIWLTIVCGVIAQAVLFGAGAVAVLSVPALAAHADVLIPNVVVASVAFAPIPALLIAPRMRLCNWGRKGWREGDFISG